MDADQQLAELVLLELPRAQTDASGQSLAIVDRLMKKFASHTGESHEIASARMDTFLAMGQSRPTWRKREFVRMSIGLMPLDARACGALC